MKTNVSVELTDEQRNRLAILLDEKASKRLVSRNEVRDLVSGLFSALLSLPGAEGEGSDPGGGRCDLGALQAGLAPAPRALRSDEAELVALLRLEGRDRSYIRGSLKALREAKGRDQYEGGFPA